MWQVGVFNSFHQNVGTNWPWKMDTGTWALHCLQESLPWFVNYSLAEGNSPWLYFFPLYPCLQYGMIPPLPWQPAISTDSISAVPEVVCWHRIFKDCRMTSGRISELNMTPDAWKMSIGLYLLYLTRPPLSLRLFTYSRHWQALFFQQMRRSGNSEENKRIIMDLDVVLKSHDCPYIVQCLGCFITEADVWICMELMATCFDKLLKRLRSPIPENVLGKVTLAVCCLLIIFFSSVC